MEETVTPTPEVPLIGVICDSPASLLAGRIARAGYRVTRVHPDDLTPGNHEDVSAWVLDCDDEDPVAEAIAWIDNRVLALSNRPATTSPVEYRHWSDRILRTLDRWYAADWHEEADTTGTTPQAFADVESVWLLAGSTGAVASVTEFLVALEEIPPVAFIYAQHIQPERDRMLTAIGNANKNVGCSLALGRHWLNPGHLLIVPASRQLQFGRAGEVFSTRDPWPSRETPNINSLMGSMSGLGSLLGGAIMFSGAGKDGCDMLPELHTMGCKLWAQEPEGCLAPMMPQTAIDTGLIEYSGTPEALAEHFLRHWS